MDSHMKLTYSSSIDNLKDLNSSFDRGVLRVAYVGRNRNGSCISKRAFEDAIKTIYNCPVVCNYNREDDSIGSHDVDIVMKDGRPVMINITQPVGVVPESANYWWETRDDDGVEHEYLCVDVIVWKRQEAYQKIKENGITDESMEIHVIKGHSEDGYYVIDDFEFLAFCLLEAAEPCYESASLEVFSKSEFRENFTRMMEEFKACFSQINPAIDGVDIAQRNMEGGEDQLDQKMELIARFGMKPEDLELNIEEMSLEDLEAKLNELTAEANKSDFSLTAEQFRAELIEALGEETVETEWGKMRRYVYCDYSQENSEVYCQDATDWKLYGFTYTVSGDSVSVDFDTKKRKKISIVDFEEGDNDASFGFAFEAVAGAAKESGVASASEQFSAEREELESKCSQYEQTIEQINSELSELRDFKAQVLSEERAEQEAAVFAMFEDLNGIEAFEALRENCHEMSIEDLEEKCYAIRGRNTTPKGVETFSTKKSGNVRVPAHAEVEARHDDEPYGGLFLKFPPNK